MEPRWLSAALGLALIVAAEAGAQPVPTPAGSSETRSDWNVSAGYSTFAFRDIAITGIPMDGSPTSLDGGGPALGGRYERSSRGRRHRFDVTFARASGLEYITTVARTAVPAGIVPFGSRARTTIARIPRGTWLSAGSILASACRPDWPGVASRGGMRPRSTTHGPSAKPVWLVWPLPVSADGPGRSWRWPGPPGSLSRDRARRTPATREWTWTIGAEAGGPISPSKAGFRSQGIRILAAATCSAESGG